jgi:23S rRNA pseudouridine1911/1915/1917 synthase
MQRKYQFTVEQEYGGYTLCDYLLHHLPGYSSNTIRKMVYNGVVKFNGELAALSGKVQVDDKITIAIPSDQAKDYAISPPQFNIIFENEDFLVVQKPAGIPVVAEQRNERNFFKEGILHYLASREGQGELRVVHRIEKEVSGAVLVAKSCKAKSPKIEKSLEKLWEERAISPEYLAIVAGVPEGRQRIEYKIASTSRHNTRMTISEFGKAAVTCYEVVETFRDFALLKITTETDRLHQIRVHLASQGHPLAVDPLYGFRNCLKLSDLKPDYQPKKDRPEKAIISRLSLHLCRISFSLPATPPFSVESPLPEDMAHAIKVLRKYRPHE